MKSLSFNFSVDSKKWQHLYSSLKPDEVFTPCFLFIINTVFEEIHAIIQPLMVARSLIKSTTLKHVIFEHVKQDICPIITRTCIYELHETKKNGYLTANTSKARFEQFVIELAKPENILLLLKKYPVLNELLIKYCTQYIQFMCEFFKSLNSEYAILGNHFSLDKDNLLIQIDKAGDRHCGTKSVLILTFLNTDTKIEQKLVYKPHSLAIDIAYNHFIDWINQQSSLGLRYSKTLDFKHHGWCEFIEHPSCESKDEIHQFYHRLGALLAIAYLLNGGDLHYENLLASGNCPIIIDHECLIQPILRINNAEKVQRKRRTVLDTLILPNRAIVENEDSSFDLSAFCDEDNQHYPEEILVITHSGTDKMGVERQRIKMSLQNNLPKFNGTTVKSSQYHASFLAGFKECYYLFIKNRAILQSRNSPLIHFSAVETRVLLKPTVEYTRLLAESFHPQLLHSRKAFEQHFTWLKNDRSHHLDMHYTPIIEAELNDLYALDIPLFTHATNESIVRNAKGKSIGSIILLNGFEALNKQLIYISQSDFIIQETIIKQSLFTSIHNTMPHEALTDSGREYCSTVKTKPHSSQLTDKKLLYKSNEILDYLNSMSLYDNGIPHWSYLSPADSKHWLVNLSSFDLYHGILGVILAFAHGYQLTRKSQYRSIVDAFTDKLDALLDTLNKKCSIGAYSGLGAFIYTIHQLQQLQFISKSDSQSLLKKITDHFDTYFLLDYPIFDIIDGSAGYLVSLISSYSSLDKETFKRQSKKCVDHLMRIYPDPHIMPENAGNRNYRGHTILGFAHGMIGVAYALWHYAKISNDYSVMPWINKALMLNQSMWNPAIKNWPDAYSLDNSKKTGYSFSWCYGNIGQNLFYLSLLNSHQQDAALPFLQASLDMTINTKLTNISNFCHGSMGTVDLFLLSEALGLHNSLRTGYTKSLTEQLILPRLEKINTINTDQIGKIFIPGIMTGISGIAYQCMRLVDPKNIPSMLSLGLI